MRILVLTAFEAEARSFVASMEHTHEVTLGKRKCLQGRFGEHDIYVSFSGIGTTSAAATTTALCECLNPDCILLCGSAGGLTAGQKTGDLVIGESIVDIDLFTLPAALTGTPYEPCLTDPHLDRAIDLEFAAHPVFLEICSNTSLGSVSKGKIVTSNTFPAPPTAFEKILAMGCNAIEMESTGVFNAAKHYDVPVIVIRAISNSLDETGKDLGTPDTALATCADRIRDFLQELLSKIHALEPIVNAKKVLETEKAIAEIITTHSLDAHPEGGYYKRTYCSTTLIDGRPSATSILFLLTKGNFSAWHSIDADETWNFYEGAPLLLRIIEPTTNTLQTIQLGGAGGMLQYTVPQGHIFSSETMGDYSLTGCSVSPGFSFDGFYLTSRAEIEARLAGRPDASELARLTRDAPVASDSAAAAGFTLPQLVGGSTTFGDVMAATALGDGMLSHDLYGSPHSRG